jgi:DNA end-binding protein Ku
LKIFQLILNRPNYQDEYRQALWQMIEAKIAGQEIVTPEPDAPSGKEVDLMKH